MAASMSPVRRPAPGRPRWHLLLRGRTMRAVLVLEAVAATLVVYGLWSLRGQVIEGEIRTMASFATAMATQADGTLTLADTALRATRVEIERGLIVAGSPAATDMLRSRVSAMPMFRGLVVVDSQGREIAASRPPGDRPPSPIDPVALAAMRTAATEAAIAGDPPQAPLRVGHLETSAFDGMPSRPLTMPWFDADGGFAGAIRLVAEPGFLDGSFAMSAPSRETTMDIYRRDLERVSGEPGTGAAHPLPAPLVDGLWRALPAEPADIMTLPDGGRRVVAARRLERAPLMLVVSRDLRAVLAEWTEEALIVGAFTASALLVTFLLALRNEREQRLRRASQAALEAEKESALRAFEAAQEGHWEWSPLTDEVHLSPRMRALIAIDREADLGPARSLVARVPVDPADLAATREAFVAPRDGRRARVDARVRVARDAGTWRHVQARGQVLRDAFGAATLFSGVASDVTVEVDAQRKAQDLEAQLQRSRRLESLGTLAGGVAHDFNNILAAVIGYAELAREPAPDGTALAHRLDQVLAAGHRGRLLVERILSFSRGGAGRRHRFALEPVIDEVLQLLDASLPATVRVRRAFDADLRGRDIVAGDATSVFEAVMNLCTNAIQAMPSGGELGVELDALEWAQPHRVYTGPIAPGAYLRLVVSDTGAGIDEHLMARLFEPFFTTKGPQQGTGLGLSIVHGVMDEIGGGIDVESLPGHGARFTLLFPRAGYAQDEVEARARADEGPRAGAVVAALPVGRGQTVMIVDDEAALVSLGEEMTAGLGYEPVGFTSAARALDAFTADPDRFDLLLSDQAMPGMNGSELAAAIHRLRPALPIVLVSGFAGSPGDDPARAPGVRAFLKKPVTRHDLARAIANALADRAEAPG